MRNPTIKKISNSARGFPCAFAGVALGIRLHHEPQVEHRIAHLAFLRAMLSFYHAKPDHQKHTYGMAKIILQQRQCPGDYLTSLAALESLHIQYPKQFVTDFHCVYPWLFENHPLITKLDKSEARVIDMQCPSIHQAHVPIHFMQTWVDYLGSMLNVPLKLRVDHPTIHLSEEEKALAPMTNHWIINAGYKKDCEAKWWGQHRYQAVVDMMPEITFVQIGERSHEHKPLRNAINLIGETMSRELVKLVSRCDGVLCGVTFVQHVAAALKKPCVCINLREPPWFTAYPRQTMLSTMGKLNCCRDRSCWASAVNDESQGTRCKLPIVMNGDATPQCAELVSPESVVSAIRSYYNPWLDHPTSATTSNRERQ